MTAIAILLFSSPRCALLCCRLARCCSHHPSETHIAGLKLHGYFVVFFSRVCSSPSPKRSLLASSLSPAETQLAGLSSTGFSTFFQLPVHPYPHLLLHQNRITMASCISFVIDWELLWSTIINIVLFVVPVAGFSFIQGP